MSLIERDDVVETFAARCSDQSLAEGVRLWNACRCLQHVKVHRFHHIVHSRRERGIAIMDQVSVAFIAREEASELLGRPAARWMFCDIPVQDATRADLEHQEDVDLSERGRDRDEEIARHTLTGMVPHKRAPRLCR
jgi:hypothetical protein